MHAFYEYNAEATRVDIIADIVKLLTGTTDKTQLSAKTIQETTNIISTIPAGWSLHDDGGGAGLSVMLTSPIHVSNFNGTQAQLDASIAASRTSLNSKFMLLSIDDNYLHMTPCEFGSTARVMLNPCYKPYDESGSQRVYRGSGGAFHINSSARHCAMYARNYNRTHVGNSNYSPSGLFERTRRAVWDTNAAGYPVSVFMSGGSHIGASPTFPRIRAMNGTDATGANAYGWTSSLPTGSTIYNACNSSSNGDFLRTAIKTVDGTLKHMFRPLWPMVPTQGFVGGDISAFADFWQFTTDIGNIGDTTVCNGNTYELWASGTVSTGLGAGFRYAVRMA